MSVDPDDLGTKPIKSLLFEQAVPASIGFVVMSIYGIVDTIFVGRFVGELGIAAITVVMPIVFLISSMGMAIGTGGASVISRAFGAHDSHRANKTLGNQVTLTLIFAAIALGLGFFFSEPILRLFGGHGAVLGPAKEYFFILVIGIPFLAWVMMANSVIRAEGESKVAMVVMVVPAFVNLILDPLFIVWLDMGIRGAAWATTLSYFASAVFTFWFIEFGGSELTIRLRYLRLDWSLSKEIIQIGSVSLGRQSAISLLSIVLNNSLVSIGGDRALAVYGMVQKIQMLLQAPLMGLTQGLLPIAGFNYGARKFNRVWLVTKYCLIAGVVTGLVLLTLVVFGARVILAPFSSSQELIDSAVVPLRVVFLASPLIIVQLVASSYYQALGKVAPALWLGVLRRGVLLIPLLIVLPWYWGLMGIWAAFPIADVLAAIVCWRAIVVAHAQLDHGEV